MLSPPTIHPTQTPPLWEREEVKWTGENERKKQREMVDAWQRFFWQLKLFYFYLSVNCLLLIFLLLFNLCGYFFVILFFCYTLPCFFVNFGGLSLPCHLLCCLLLFVYFFYQFFFFYLHGFSGGVVSLIALGTSSLRLVMPPRGVGCTAPPFRGQVSKGSKLYNWWFGKASGLIDTNWWIWYFEETVDDGLGGRCLDAGRCPVTPPPWLVMAGRSGRWCQLLCFCFFIFWKSMEIAGKVLEWKKGSLLNCWWVGRWIPQCFPKHYSCYDTDRTAEITDAPTS